MAIKKYRKFKSSSSLPKFSSSNKKTPTSSSSRKPSEVGGLKGTPGADPSEIRYELRRRQKEGYSSSASGKFTPEQKAGMTKHPDKPETEGLKTINKVPVVDKSTPSGTYLGGGVYKGTAREAELARKYPGRKTAVLTRSEITSRKQKFAQKLKYESAVREYTGELVKSGVPYDVAIQSARTGQVPIMSDAGAILSSPGFAERVETLQAEQPIDRQSFSYGTSMPSYGISETPVSMITEFKEPKGFEGIGSKLSKYKDITRTKYEKGDYRYSIPYAGLGVASAGYEIISDRPSLSESFAGSKTFFIKPEETLTKWSDISRKKVEGGSVKYTLTSIGLGVASAGYETAYMLRHPVKTGKGVLSFGKQLFSEPKSTLSNLKENVVASAKADPFFALGKVASYYAIPKIPGKIFEAGRGAYIKAGSQYVAPESVFSSQVLSGAEKLPTVKGIAQSEKMFQVGKGTTKVSTASPAKISGTEAGIGKKAGLGLEDPGIFVTPAGEGSPYFLRISKDLEAGYSLNPLKGIKEKFGVPTVTEFEVAGVKRYPRSVVEKPGFTEIEKFQRGVSGEGYAYITKRSELGQSVLKPQQFKPSSKAKPIREPGTSELEAVIPVGSQFEYAPKTTFGKIKGFEQYTTFEGQPVAIRQAKVLKTSKGSFGMETPTSTSKIISGKQIKAESSSLSVSSYKTPSYSNILRLSPMPTSVKTTSTTTSIPRSKISGITDLKVSSFRPPKKPSLDYDFGTSQKTSYVRQTSYKTPKITSSNIMGSSKTSKTSGISQPGGSSKPLIPSKPSRPIMPGRSVIRGLSRTSAFSTASSVVPRYSYYNPFESRGMRPTPRRKIDTFGDPNIRKELNKGLGRRYDYKPSFAGIQMGLSAEKGVSGKTFFSGFEPRGLKSSGKKKKGLYEEALFGKGRIKGLI